MSTLDDNVLGCFIINTSVRDMSGKIEKKPGCIYKVHLRDWLRETHFVDTPKVYCCYRSWLVVTSQNSLNLL